MVEASNGGLSRPGKLLPVSNGSVTKARPGARGARGRNPFLAPGSHVQQGPARPAARRVFHNQIDLSLRSRAPLLANPCGDD